MSHTYSGKANQQLQTELLNVASRNLIVASKFRTDRTAYYTSLLAVVNQGQLISTNIETADAILTTQLYKHSFSPSINSLKRDQTPKIRKQVRFHPDLDSERASEKEQRLSPPIILGHHDKTVNCRTLF
jgi:hypothetical protein